MAVLYADVSGSTRLYETYGDTKASADIHLVLDILNEVAEEYDGRKIKTIGDEIMCMFQKPERTASAAIRMNEVLREACDEKRFQCGELHVKMGWHYGTGIFRGDDIVGEAPTLAQQAICMAKRDEILTTKQSVDELPAILKCSCFFIDRVEAEDGSGNLDIFALPWDDDEGEATQLADSPEEIAPGGADRALLLRYRGKTLEMDAKFSHCRIGRGEDNDLVIKGQFTSRHHGEIYYRHGRFHLCDMSTNGTAIIQPPENLVRLHREETSLHDAGTICFGGEPNSDPGAAVQYQCIKQSGNKP